MSVLQTIPLLGTTVKMRWQEPYVTSGLNEKALAAFPKGVVSGFKVVPNSGYNVELQADPVSGLSIANVVDTTGATQFGVTVIQTGSLFADLTAQAGLTVFITLDAQYAVGAASAAQLRVVDAAELLANVDLIVLAKVSVPASPVPGPPVVTANINMGYRTLSGDAVPEQAKPRFNLINNPDFETDALAAAPAGWFFFGSLTGTASADFAHTGLQSLKLVAGGTGFANSAYVPVVAGESYRAGAWVRTSLAGLVGSGLQMRVEFFDKGFVFLAGTDISLEAPATGVVTAFTEKKMVVTAPALAAHARIQALFVSTTGTAYIDTVEFSHSHSDSVARSIVFGGLGSVADQYHGHTSAGSTYSAGPAWHDGTTNPANTVQGQLDKIVSDLAGIAGSAKLGFTPVAPVDLTANQLDLALSELDAKKAGLAQPNVFTKNNTFNNTVANTTGVTSYGQGTGAGVIGQGGDTGSGGAGLAGYGRTSTTNAHGVFGAANNYAPWTHAGGPFGVVGLGGDTGGYGHGVVGIGCSADGGSGIVGVDKETTPLPDASIAAGGRFQSSGGNPALYAAADQTDLIFGNAIGIWGQGGVAGGVGVRGDAGANSGQAGVFGSGGGGTGSGGYFAGGFGGDAYGVFGQGHGVGDAGSGVYGLGTGLAAAGVFGDGFGGGGSGVVGRGGTSSPGVEGRGGGTSGVGVLGTGGGTNGPGMRAVGTGTGAGLIGLANGATATPTSVGVYGKGNIGGWFVGTQAGGIALEVDAMASGVSVAIEALGYGGGPAIDCYSGDGGQSFDLIRLQGYIAMPGAFAPAKTTGFTNRLTPNNLIKAWARYRYNNSASPVYIDGFNIASIAAGSGTFGANTVVDVTFGAGMADSNYAVIFMNSAAGVYFPQIDGTRATGAFKIAVETLSAVGSLNSPSNVTTSLNNVEVSFLVLGRQ